MVKLLWGRLSSTDDWAVGQRPDAFSCVCALLGLPWFAAPDLLPLALLLLALLYAAFDTACLTGFACKTRVDACVLARLGLRWKGQWVCDVGGRVCVCAENVPELMFSLVYS